MEINCIICSDLFSQKDEMVINQCGHMFHHTCLLQWMERSKTCPQCRSRASEKSIHKVYFNFLNTDNITDNVGTLQAKLDGANFKLRLRDKELKDLYEKYDSREATNIQLRDLVMESEKKKASLESGILGLKEQVGYYKKKSAETERLMLEVSTLKSALQEVEQVQTLINGTRTEVNEILKNETNIDSLALLTATLKKTLMDVEQKCTLRQNRLKHAQNQISKYKMERSALESSNLELKKNLSLNKKAWEEEKQYLKQKISELTKLVQKQSKLPEAIDNSINRILVESPAPLPRRKKINCDNSETKSSPSVAEMATNIMESDSPYLQMKNNFVAYAPKYSTLVDKKSIFKTGVQATSPKKRPTQTAYTGLGGQVNEASLRFPERKSPSSGLKRHKSSSSISSTKFRKLAPLPSTTNKITDYIILD